MPDLQLQPSLRRDLRSQAILRLVQRLNAPAPVGVPLWAPGAPVSRGTVILIPEPWDSASRSGMLLVCVVDGVTGMEQPPAAPAESIIQDGSASWRVTVAGTIDLTPLLVYWIDQVDASVLPYLRWQFDLTSSFWQLLITQSQPDASRAIVALGMALHRRRGTPSAITGYTDAAGVRHQGILDALGWQGALQEGQQSWGGDLTVPPEWSRDQGWAVYWLQITATPRTELPADLTWRPDLSYQPGDLVTFPGPTGGYYLRPDGSQVVYGGAPGGLYQAVGGSHGVPPYYFAIGDVGSVEWLSIMGPLTTKFWVQASPYRFPTLADLALLRAACEFFAPERCYLDRIITSFPGFQEQGAPEQDAFSFGHVNVAPIIEVEGRSGDFLFLTLAGLPAVPINTTENEAEIPIYDGSYLYSGSITYAGVPIGGADVLIINGVPAMNGGSL